MNFDLYVYMSNYGDYGYIDISKESPDEYLLKIENWYYLHSDKGYNPVRMNIDTKRFYFCTRHEFERFTSRWIK